MKKAIHKTTASALETIELGHQFGSKLVPGSIVAFFGDLAAGKTTFIKGLVEGAAGISSFEVNSPTFTYLNIYEGKKTVYHFDLYRINNQDEFLEMDFSEYFFAGGICCIEWADHIEGLLPKGTIKVKIEHQGKNTRQFSWGQS